MQRWPTLLLWLGLVPLATAAPAPAAGRAGSRASSGSSSSQDTQHWPLTSVAGYTVRDRLRDLDEASQARWPSSRPTQLPLRRFSPRLFVPTHGIRPAAVAHFDDARHIDARAMLNAQTNQSAEPSPERGIWTCLLRLFGQP